MQVHLKYRSYHIAAAAACPQTHTPSPRPYQHTPARTSSPTTNHSAPFPPIVSSRRRHMTPRVTQRHPLAFVPPRSTQSQLERTSSPRRRSLHVRGAACVCVCVCVRACVRASMSHSRQRVVLASPATAGNDLLLLRLVSCVRACVRAFVSRDSHHGASSTLPKAGPALHAPFTYTHINSLFVTSVMSVVDNTYL